MEQPRRLYRSEDDRMLAGICSTVHRSLTTGSLAFEPSVVMLSPPSPVLLLWRPFWEALCDSRCG